jgi:hypothetical protein
VVKKKANKKKPRRLKVGDYVEWMNPRFEDGAKPMRGRVTEVRTRRKNGHPQQMVRVRFRDAYSTEIGKAVWDHYWWKRGDLVVVKVDAIDALAQIDTGEEVA